VKVAGKDAHRTRIHLFLTIVGLVGIPGLFLPFVGHASPLDAVLLSKDNIFYLFWRAGLPAFVVVPASLASIRWMVSGSLSLAEKVIAYLTAASMACISLSFWLEGVLDKQSVLFCTIEMFVLGLGIVALMRNSKMPSASRFNPVLSLQVVYVAHVIPWLPFGFHPESGGVRIGAYLILIAALAYVVQMVLVSVQTE
jgi:hypothetical protein